MKVSRAEIASRAQERRTLQRRTRARSRGAELLGLIAGSIVVVSGLVLVYRAKVHNAGEVEKNTLNLNELVGPQQLIPYLGMVAGAADQDFIARHIYDVKRHGETFSNVGRIARLRVTEGELARARGLSELPKRLAEARARRSARELRGGEGERELSIPLLTAAEFAQMKPNFRVRDAGEYGTRVVVWSVLFFVAFYAVHVMWRVRGFGGDTLIVPVIQALCGIGLILMIGLRDPLRDNLLFADFTQGVIAGCAALVVFSVPDYERQFRKLSYVPLVGALLLAIALGIFGSGPGGSDAKVNLFFFQPVELIRILIVFFLAGYFAQNWDALRQLKQRGGRLAKVADRFSVPRLDYVLPVIVAVLISIALFFWLSDLGPALVIGCLFLTMYSIARNRVLLACAGLAAIIAAFVIGYATGYPHTVRERVEMWKSPWDNRVRGGDQLADSLWSLCERAARRVRGWGWAIRKACPRRIRIW